MGMGTGTGAVGPRAGSVSAVREPHGFCVSRSKGTRAGGFSSACEGRKQPPAEPPAPGHTAPAAPALTPSAGGPAPLPLLPAAAGVRGCPRSAPSPPPQGCEPAAEFCVLLIKIGHGEASRGAATSAWDGRVVGPRGPCMGPPAVAWSGDPHERPHRHETSSLQWASQVFIRIFCHI